MADVPFLEGKRHAGLSRRGKGVALWLLDNLVWVILVVALGAFSLWIEGFAQWGIFRNIFYHATFVGLLAISQAMCIISREMDLSIESILALSAISTGFLTGLSADASGYEMNGVLVLGIVVLIGGLIGLMNGVLITKVKINSFIITLAGYLVFRAAGLIITDGHGITGLPSEMRWVARTEVGPIPVMIVVLIATYVVFNVFLTRTQVGRYMYLIGDNREAARNAGIKVESILTWVFILSGAVAGFAGWLLAARTDGASPSIGSGILFEAFAAVVIGGVSLQGGIGRLSGVFAGAILLSAISTVITVVGIPPFYMNVIRGGLITVAVLLDALVSRIRPKLL